MALEPSKNVSTTFSRTEARSGENRPDGLSLTEEQELLERSVREWGARELHGADAGDTTTIVETAIAAAEQVEEAQAGITEPQPLEEIISDKGYHSNQTLVDLHAVDIRSYIAEPDRGRRDWSEAPEAPMDRSDRA